MVIYELGRQYIWGGTVYLLVRITVANMVLAVGLEACVFLSVLYLIKGDGGGMLLSLLWHSMHILIYKFITDSPYISHVL
jgi:hypothetical protein